MQFAISCPALVRENADRMCQSRHDRCAFSDFNLRVTPSRSSNVIPDAAKSSEAVPVDSSTSFPLHRIVLASAAPFFAGLFQSLAVDMPAQESIAGCSIADMAIELPDHITAAHVDAFFEFCYAGRVHVESELQGTLHLDTVLALIELADMFGVEARILL
jgi:hypothetical protein